MQCANKYSSPLGNILIAADDSGVIGLWFEGQKNFADKLEPTHSLKKTPILLQAAEWLDIYFSGKNPDFTPPLNIIGRNFQKRVWNLLLKVPYGQTTTYGAIAKDLEIKTARPVGVALAHNPISLIIPCHRVIGSDGSLMGYSGGIEKKRWLLETEQLGLKKASRLSRGVRSKQITSNQK